METHRREILKKQKKKKISFILVNIKQTKSKRHKITFKLQQNICSILALKSQQNKMKPHSVSDLPHITLLHWLALEKKDGMATATRKPYGPPDTRTGPELAVPGCPQRDEGEGQN